MMNERVVVLNGAKMNYDGKLDFSVLSPDTVVYDDSQADEIVERIDGAARRKCPFRLILYNGFPTA